MSVKVRGRETAVRCSKCHAQASRTAGTPLHHFKLPLWTFGYILHQAMLSFPQMLSAAQIRRRLGVSKTTALLLKRRLQLFLSDLVPEIKTRIADELNTAYANGENAQILPENGDVSAVVANKPVVHMDTLALFSASQRANGGRSRRSHSGQTASIYLNHKVAEERGVYQIGTLAHTIAIKHGPVILDSVSELKQKSIQPLLSFLPEHAPTFTDEGYPWLARYNKNHRAVNHSARARDKKRSKWARNRWSRNGVHNQVAEGTQRIVKQSFLAAYSYFKPENSQLYLDEFSALKAIRVYGLNDLLKTPFVRNVDQRYSDVGTRTRRSADARFLRRKLAEKRYQPPDILSRGYLRRDNARRQIRGRLKTLLEDNRWFELRQAHIDYLNFWPDASHKRKTIEQKYNARAQRLWQNLRRHEHLRLARVAEQIGERQTSVIHIVRRWAKLGVVDVFETKDGQSQTRQIHIRREIELLPDILYSFEWDEYLNHKHALPKTRAERAERRGTHGLTQSERTQIIEEVFDEQQHKNRREEEESARTEE